MPDGRLLSTRRKLVPTSGERLVHAMGDGSTFRVYDTAVGRLGALIGWENYMPLARHALYCQGQMAMTDDASTAFHAVSDPSSHPR